MRVSVCVCVCVCVSVRVRVRVRVSVIVNVNVSVSVSVSVLSCGRDAIKVTIIGKVVFRVWNLKLLDENTKRPFAS